MPQAPSSVAVRRVSSANTRSAPIRLVRARGLKSSMLPIGVAMTSSLPPAAATIISACHKERPGAAGLRDESSLPGTVPPMQSSLSTFSLSRLIGALLCLSALAACTSFPRASFPPAGPGAASAEAANERRAAALALENAARKAPPAEQAPLQLQAARAWLQAGRGGEAQRVLAGLSANLTPVQSIERRVLEADIDMASGQAQQAWREMSVIPAPTGTALAPQYFDSRM